MNPISPIHEKIFFEYEDLQGNLFIEEIWALNFGDEFKIDSIPIYVKGYALGDFVSVEYRNEQPFVTSLISKLGHSTIRITFYNKEKIKWVQTYLRNFECRSIITDNPNILAVDIPEYVDYGFLKGYLNKGVDEGNWIYEELCLTHEI